MLQLDNHTPFESRLDLFRNESGMDAVYVGVKASFALDNPLAPLTEQIAFVLADEYGGVEGESSLKRGVDLQLKKAVTDILLIGTAYAPEGGPVSELDARLCVGEQLKTVRVFGDRIWERRLWGWKASEPEPFERMPLEYERAFGGSYITDAKGLERMFDERNPVGIGLCDRRKKRDMRGEHLPNLEDPENLIGHPMDRPDPVCFGYVAPNWSPRKDAAGTYDDVWHLKRAPYLPDDFHRSFFNAAHPDLVCEGYLSGGESVEMENLTPSGLTSFRLPVCEMELAVETRTGMVHPSLDMETLLFEPDENRFSMIWRAEVEYGKRVADVERVELKLNGIHSTGRPGETDGLHKG